MAAMDRDKLYIGGEWVEPASTATIEVISPHTEEVVAHGARGVERRRRPRRRRGARRASTRATWPRRAAGERIAAVQRFSRRLQARYERHRPRSITEEMGSPISFSIMGQVVRRRG